MENVIDYIDYMKSKQKEGLKDNLKSKIDQAYDIANNIYNENKGARDLKEIEKMVKDALRTIRFNDGRGYYFATRLDGVEQLFVDRPEMEGKNMLDVRDTNGKYVIRDMIDIAETQKEGAYEYTWTKPGHEGKDFPKIAYIRLFEPFNWFIGSGEYLDDKEKDVQDLVLNRIAEIRFGNDGYVYVVTYNGVVLMNDIQKDQIGKNIWELTDPEGVKVIQEERKAVENPDGGFIQYQWKKTDESRFFPKITYVKGIPEWEWVIGADVYLDEIDETINENKKTLEQRIRNQLIKVSLLLLFLLTATYITSKYIISRIDKSLVTFSSFFHGAAAESIKIDLKGINFSEFENLALSANRMIEQHEQAERSLKESEEKYRTLFNMESDALGLIEIKTGKIIDVNNAFSNLFGNEKEEILKMKEDNFLTGFNRSDEKSGNDAAYLPVFYGKKKGGALFPAEIDAREFEYQGRRVRLLVIRDISDRKKLEDQLRQAQKMEALGTLAGGIAHDFNNVLLPIMGHAEMLMMGLPPESHIQYNLKQIYEASNRAKDMIKQIMAFSRKDRQEKKPVKLGPIINDTVKLLRGSIPTTIDIKYDIKTDADTVMANSTQIHQVLLNLCTNAAYAMREKGGILQVELDDYVLDTDHSVKFNRLIPGKYMRLTVKDTGSGIEKEVVEKIFEPYFTTKKTGEGTGMGLAVVHGIVLDHKGDISVETEHGKGTEFSILLPSYRATKDNKIPGIEGSTEIVRGNERILLVDDDKIVVDVLQEMLINLGYKITARTSSVEALESFRNNPHKFDLIITDMTMPNMTGKDLAVEMLSMRPDIPIILSTGFSERIDEESARAVGIKALVMKPVVMNKLARIIREVLDGQNECPAK